MSRYKCSVLVVEDDSSILTMMYQSLQTDYELHCSDRAEQAQVYLLGHTVDIVVVDQELPGLSGLALLEWVRDHYPKTIRILMTGLSSLEQAVDAINSSLAQRFLFKPFYPHQIISLLRNASRMFLLERSHEQLLDDLFRLNRDLEERVAQRTHDLEVSNKQLAQRNQMLQRMALTDELTSLPNRRVIDRLVKNELLRRTRVPFPLAISLIDVDHFKDINTNYLLPGGDFVLQWLSLRMVNAVRTIDTVGRVGGEEFMVVAPDTNLDGAKTLSERIRKNIEEGEIHYQNDLIRITISVGTVVVEEETLIGYEEMREAAASALSQAKKSGRNCCIVQRIEKSSKSSWSDLKIALADQDLDLPSHHGD